MAPKKARDRKRQTKINFSPASQSSPATKSTAATTMGTSPSRPNLTATTPTRRAPSRVSNKSNNNNKHDSSSEAELVVGTNKAMRLGMPVGGTARGMFDGSNNGSASSNTSEEEDEVQVEQPKSRKRRRAATPSESEDEEPTVTVIPRKRQRRVIEIGSDTSEKPKSKNKEEKRKTKSSKASKRRERKESTPEEEELRPAPRSSRRKTAEKAPTPDEDEDEDEPLTPAPSSRRKIVRRRSPSAEEEEQSPPRSTRRRLKRRKSLSEDEEEPSATPQLTNRGDSASDNEDEEEGEGSANNDENDEEQDELKEELAFLRSSPLPDRGRLRSTQGKPKNRRQEALEALKRRRAGTNEPPSSATPGRKRALVVETDSESELEVIKEEPDSDLEILEQDDIEDDEQESDRDANALDMFQEDQEDEHFIDDDPDNVIGEPSVNDDLDEMRLAFSLSRAKTRDLFKHAVEWMVMKKIHPAFDAEKNVYVLTFRKLDDEVKGLAGSKYTSSAWTADFTRAIRARPLLLMNELSAAERAVMSPHCEACNRTNHTASFEVLFQGQPYHPETLEPLANASDDSDSDSDSALSADSETHLNGEKPTFNYQGDRIPPESHRFPLGSTCKANAQVAHTLYHWRYNLYQWVKDYLKDEGYLTAEKLVKRDGRSDRKREKEARKIVDTMEENGRIRQLYHSYKDQLRAAVEADNDYANGWGRRG